MTDRALTGIPAVLQLSRGHFRSEVRGRPALSAAPVTVGADSPGHLHAGAARESGGGRRTNSRPAPMLHASLHRDVERARVVRASRCSGNKGGERKRGGESKSGERKRGGAGRLFSGP